MEIPIARHTVTSRRYDKYASLAEQLLEPYDLTDDEWSEAMGELEDAISDAVHDVLAPLTARLR